MNISDSDSKKLRIAGYAISFVSALILILYLIFTIGYKKTEGICVEYNPFSKII